MRSVNIKVEKLWNEIIYDLNDFDELYQVEIVNENSL